MPDYNIITFRWTETEYIGLNPISPFPPPSPLWNANWEAWKGTPCSYPPFIHSAFIQIPHIHSHPRGSCYGASWDDMKSITSQCNKESIVYCELRGWDMKNEIFIRYGKLINWTMFMPLQNVDGVVNTQCNNTGGHNVHWVRAEKQQTMSMGNNKKAIDPYLESV